MNDIVEAFLNNPFCIAGLAAVQDDQQWTQYGLGRIEHFLARCANPSSDADLAAILFTVLRVAQVNYGDRDQGGYWPHLATTLNRPCLDQPEHDRIGDWVATALQRFGYRWQGFTQRNIGPILWHAGFPEQQLPQLLAFIANQLDTYGPRAAEPDAIHDLRLVEVARRWNPPLPRAIWAIIDDSSSGFDHVWGLLAEAICEYRASGETAVRATWNPVGSIRADQFLAALSSLNQLPSGRSNHTTVRRPQLRYDSQSGELLFWLLNGVTSDWEFNGLTCHPQPRTFRVLPPLCARFTIRRRSTGETWTEDLFVSNQEIICFQTRTGALIRGNLIQNQGLPAGEYVLVGRYLQLPHENRLPLCLGFLQGGEGWAAWRVEVPEWSLNQPNLPLATANRPVQIPLRRRGGGRIEVLTPPVLQALMDDGQLVPIYAAAPSVRASRENSVRLLRRQQTGWNLISQFNLSAQRILDLPTGGSGIYQLREVRGMQRVLCEFALIPGAVPITVQHDVDHVRFNVLGHENTQPAWEPWIEHEWRDPNSGTQLLIRQPVQALRWRLDSEPWTREAIAFQPRHPGTISVEVPTTLESSLRIQGHPVMPTEIHRSETGSQFTFRVAAYAQCNEIYIHVGGEQHLLAWRADIPRLGAALFQADNSELAYDLQFEHITENLAIEIRDALDPIGQPVVVPLYLQGQARIIAAVPIPALLQGAGWLAVQVGRLGRQGFQQRFVPAEGCQVQLVEVTDGSPSSQFWAALVHNWLQSQRNLDLPPPAFTMASLGQLNGIDLRHVRCFYLRLRQAPCTWPQRQQVLQTLEALFHHLAPHTLAEIAAAPDPNAELAHWLAVGIQPIRHLRATQPAFRDTIAGYPFRYLQDLQLLNEYNEPIQDRRAAADRVWQAHLGRGLFLPTRALPASRGVLRTRPGSEHMHVFTLTQMPETMDSFLYQVLGEDCYLANLCSAPGDQFPQTQFMVAPPNRFAGRRSNAIEYRSTIYSAGWLVGDVGWQFDRRQQHPIRGHECFLRCCETAYLQAEAWHADQLVEHLDLVSWLLRESNGHKFPNLNVPAIWRTWLNQFPASQTHARVLDSPAIESRELFGRRVNTPAYHPIPPAGQLAWQLAWLDCCRVPGLVAQIEACPVYQAGMREALTNSSPWAELVFRLIMTVEYVQTILAGGIGPAFRFSNNARTV